MNKMLLMKDWDNKKECMKEAERLGYTKRIGYLAWCAGQSANGYESVLSFFDDIKELINNTKNTIFVRHIEEHLRDLNIHNGIVLCKICGMGIDEIYNSYQPEVDKKKYLKFYEII